jgi:hypothetical protein
MGLYVSLIVSGAKGLVSAGKNLRVVSKIVPGRRMKSSKGLKEFKGVEKVQKVEKV